MAVKPYISFVIPTFNRVETLKEIIKSILSQKELFEYEIIVVDNSANFSEDNETFKYIKKLNSSKILYYINEKNIGFDGNSNRCIELARGKYVSMIHDDDLIVQNYMEQIKGCIEKAEKLSKSSLGMIKVSYLKFIDGKEIPNPQNKNKYGIKKYYKFQTLFEGRGPSAGPTCGMIFNAKAVLDVGGFNSAYCPSSDHILGYLILKKGYDVFITEDRLGLYRIGLNDSMKKETLKGFCRMDYYFREFMYSENGIYKLFGKMFRNIQYSLSVDECMRAAKLFKTDISKEEIIFTDGYKERPVGIFVFKVLRKIIRILCKNNIKN